MAGTRTAPTIDGTPTFKSVSLKWIDTVGDIRTDTYRFTTGTATEVEAFVSAMQSLSNASLWGVDVADKYRGAMSKANAADVPFVSKDDNVVVLMKEATGRTFDMFVPAPVESVVMVAGTEQVDTTTLATLVSTMAALQTLVYSPVSARYSERRDKNPRVLF